MTNPAWIDRTTRLVSRARAMIMTRRLSSPNNDPAPPPRVGDDLRAAREKAGLALDAIAARLRIRSNFLHALETGELSALPGPFYVISFLRLYAAALGLDPADMVERFKAEVGVEAPRARLDFPSPQSARGWPAGALVLLGLVLTVCAYAGWYSLTVDGRPPSRDARIPARLAPLADDAASRPRPAVAASVPLATDAAREDAEPPPLLTSPSSASAAQIPPLALAPAPVAQPAPPPPTDPGLPRIVLRANASTWVRVRERGGLVLIDRILHAGESIGIPPDPSLLLSLGNAGGADLVVDGTPSPTLGGSGAVLKDLPLDPDLLKDMLKEAAKEGKLDLVRAQKPARPR